MRIIAKRTLREFWTKHAHAEQPLRAWFADVSRSRWKSPQDVKRIYATASIVGNDRVVFNVKGNDYRLVVRVSYRSGLVFVRFVGTHKQYDKIDVATI